MDNIELKKIIAEALDVDESLVTNATEEGTIEEWDSLGQLSILTLLDSKIDGDISGISELGKANSVMLIQEILTKKGFMK
tara:strand:+ start:560 stop:799 length:240 start_codon:yes stop_codon:yes gene_type:complete